MASKGKCCCPDPACPTVCTEFFASYYDASISFNGITKVIRINQGIANLCQFNGGLCWDEPSEKLGELNIEIEPGYTIPAAASCFESPPGNTCDETFDLSEFPDPSGDGQVTVITRGRPAYTYAVNSGHYKQKIQRWGKRQYRADINVYQISGTSMRIRVAMISAQAIRYSVSCCTQAVHAIVTCPACADRTCITTMVGGGATGTVCTPSPYVTPACTIGAWIGYAPITLAEPIDPFGTVTPSCGDIPPFPWNPALPVDCPPNPTYGTTTVNLTGYSCVDAHWTTYSYTVNVNTGTVCYNDSVSHICPNGCLYVYCLTQEDTVYGQYVNYYSEPFPCTSLCGAKAVYRDTPQPEVTGRPTVDYPAGETEDPDCVTYYGSMSQKRKYTAWPATFNVTICS